LDDMSSFQNIASDRTRLGYQGSTSKSQRTTGNINFVKAKPVNPIPQKQSKVKFTPICHHCGIVGHIRPKCFKLNKVAPHDFFLPICHNCGVKGHIKPNCHELKKTNVNARKNEKSVKPTIRTIWVRKSDLNTFVEVEHSTLDDFEDSRVIDLAL